MRNPFELAPLAVVALVGGAIAYLVLKTRSGALLGVGIGVGAQVAVRLLGVS